MKKKKKKISLYACACDVRPNGCKKDEEPPKNCPHNEVWKE